MSEQITYKSSGVDIDAGEETVNRIKPLVRKTFNSAVLSDLGSFGALYDAKFPAYKHPVLVSSVDGVGTKLKVAQAVGKHDTIGQDLINHCVNDILVCGAKPLYFLDYFATGKLVPQTAEQVIGGMAKACEENGCALIGGETAEMPGVYNGEEYDLAGTVVGVAEKELILKKDNVKNGNVLIALPSTGLHTNGYSLARRVILRHHEFSDHSPELGKTFGEALLAVHKSYLKPIYPCPRSAANWCACPRSPTRCARWPPPKRKRAETAARRSRPSATSSPKAPSRRNSLPIPKPMADSSPTTISPNSKRKPTSRAARRSADTRSTSPVSGPRVPS